MLLYGLIACSGLKCSAAWEDERKNQNAHDLSQHGYDDDDDDDDDDYDDCDYDK